MNDSEIGWSDLPFDLLAQITDKVISFSLSDYNRFSCVCIRWRSFFIQNNYYEQIRLSNLPVLLNPSSSSSSSSSSFNHDTNYQKQLQQQQQQQQQEEQDNLRISHNYYNHREIWVGMDHKQRHQSARSFFSLSERKLYDFQLPIPSYMNCRGTFEMGFCRPGDRAWTPLPEPSHADIWDFIYYKGQFWGILQDGGAVVYDINVPEPKVTILVEPHQDDIRYPDSRYLVESAGDLFQVRRDILMSDDDGNSTVGFQVFKLDLVVMEWVKTNTLDGRMFFLGDNASISLSNFAGGGWCKPNSIYCTDAYEDGYNNTKPCEGPHDMGVFNLDDGSFEAHYIQKSKTVIMP